MSEFKLFPRSSKTCTNRSLSFEVGCGEAALLTAYNLPEGFSVCINKMYTDHCKCEHFEKQHCQLGEPAGVNDECCEAVIVMPGKYVGVLCYEGCDENPDIDKDWAVYVNVCNAHENLRTLFSAASLEAK